MQDIAIAMKVLQAERSYLLPRPEAYQPVARPCGYCSQCSMDHGNKRIASQTFQTRFKTCRRFARNWKSGASVYSILRFSTAANPEKALPCCPLFHRQHWKTFAFSPFTALQVLYSLFSCLKSSVSWNQPKAKRITKFCDLVPRIEEIYRREQQKAQQN
ncbi:hypothetical protein BJX63DRAFT_190436 [Aspergillus granulosus]|uniref:Uncharacterized protein n=1 Tax=Aspergillus granulosus TaxID=176169 RepID=A0ABR4HGZ6_9EURO